MEKIREMKCAKRKKSHLKDFPSSRPLKKRPVDASLFKKLQSSSSPSSSPEVQTSPMVGGASAYTYGGRPLALADTRSVVQAAMQALIHSQAGASPMAQLQQTASNGVFPLMASATRHPTLNTDVLVALQAATQRRGSPSSSTS